MKSITCNSLVDHLQGSHRYNMILGRDIFSKLKIYLCFSENTIRGGGGAYEVGTSPMKEIFNINAHILSYWNKKKLLEKIIIGEWTCDALHVIHVTYLRRSL